MFRKFLGAALSLAVGVGVLLPGLVHAQGDDEVQPTNIVITIEGVASYNRVTWDNPNTENLALPGTPLHSDDYVLVSGDSAVLVICADLSTIELLADGTPECTNNPDEPAFVTFDSLDWNPAEVDILVTGDTSLPDGVAEDIDVQITDDLSQVSAYVSSIRGLSVDDESQAFLLAYMLASNGLYLDAINALQSIEDLQCTEQRSFVEIDDEATVSSVPSTYLYLGEWFAIAGNNEISERYLQCAREAADEIGDHVSYALASVRLASLASDADVAASRYQEAIDRYAELTATEAMDTVLDLCGSANCTQPE